MIIVVCGRERERERERKGNEIFEKREKFRLGMCPMSEPALASCSHPILVLVSTCYLLHGSAPLILSRARSADCDVTAVDVEWSCAPALSAHTSRPLSVTLPRPSAPVAVTRHVCPRALWPLHCSTEKQVVETRVSVETTRLCCRLDQVVRPLLAVFGVVIRLCCCVLSRLCIHFGYNFI